MKYYLFIHHVPKFLYVPHSVPHPQYSNLPDKKTFVLYLYLLNFLCQAKSKILYAEIS